MKAWASCQTENGVSASAKRLAWQCLACAIVAILVVTWWATPLGAQTTFGSILGIVTDPSGAAIPGASVTLTNLGTEAHHTSQSDANGNYQFLNLDPGNYSLDFSKSGFSHLKRDSITVTVQAAVRVNATLQVGNVNQTVNVTAQAPLIETQPSAIGQLVEGKVVQQMPLNGRNVFNLVTLAPGVIPGGSTGGNPLGNQAGGVFTNNTGFGNYQIGGGMPNQSAFYLDGVPLNTTYINSPALVPTQDAIQEFRVDTNAVSAQFGRFAGGVVNMATKSGTNQVHGSAYEYIRNKVLNANTFFNNRAGLPTPAFTQNQFGGTLGGPLWRGKLFGFFSGEGFSFRTGSSTTDTVPEAAFYHGDFSSLCSLYDSNGVCVPGHGTQLYDPLTTCGITGAPACPPGQTTPRLPFAYNKIPESRLDVASQQMFKYYALPNQPATLGPGNLPINNFVSNVSLGGNSYQYTGRVDWVASQNQRIFGRYSYWTGTSRPADPFHTHFGGLYSYTGSQNIVLGDTYTINPNTIADFRVSYLRGRDGFTPEQYGVPLSLFGPAWAALASQVTAPVPPGMTMSSGWTGFGVVLNKAIMNDYFASGSLIKVLGRHTLKFGGELRNNEWYFGQSNSPGGSFSFDPGFTAQFDPAKNNAQVANTGYAGASFFLGNPASGNVNALAFTDSFEWYVGLYLQDTYQVNRKLTITPGIRWEWPQDFTERNDRLTVLLPNAVDPLGTAVGLPLHGQLALVNTPAYPGHSQNDNHFKLFSPRMNVAYAATNNTSIRAGYGISYIPPDMVNYSASPFQSPVNKAVTTMVASAGGTTDIYPVDTFGSPFSTGLIPPIGHNPAQLSILEGQNVASPIPNQHYGYAQQWDLDVQQELTPSLMIDIGYAGSKGSHLSFSSRQLDQLPDSLLSMGKALNAQVPNPFYGHISSGLLAGPKVSQAQLLRPFPQFNGFSDTAAQVGDSHWNALETRLIKHFKTGGIISASYTWSKLISNTDSLTSWLEPHGAAGVQDWNNLAAEKSLASFDVPHRFVLSYVLQLPFGRNQHFLSGASPFVNEVIGGWSVNGITTLQSGFPLFFSTVTNQTGSQGGGSRPNVVPGQPKKIKGSAQSRLNEWYNTAAFALPAPFTFGDETRTDSELRDAGIANWDFTAGKTFPLRERLNFEFKAEFFNIFNRVQFGDPGDSVGSSNYGRVSSTIGNPRLVQFSGRFVF